jgi:hypothetical protein
MLQPSATHQKKTQDHQNHVDRPVVSPQTMSGKHQLDPAMKLDDPKVSPDQLQPSISGDVLGSKFDLKKALARRAKIGSTESHLEWPPCRVIWSVLQLLYLLQRQAISGFKAVCKENILSDQG